MVRVKRARVQCQPVQVPIAHQRERLLGDTRFTKKGLCNGALENPGNPVLAGWAA